MLRLCDEVCSVYLQYIISFALLVNQDWRPSMAGALLVHTPTSESHKSWSSWKKFDTAWKMAVAVVELSRGGSAAFPLFWCCLTRNKHTPLAENTDLSDIYFSSHRIAKTGKSLTWSEYNLWCLETIHRSFHWLYRLTEKFWKVCLQCLSPERVLLPAIYLVLWESLRCYSSSWSWQSTWRPPRKFRKTFGLLLKCLTAVKQILP